MLFPADAVGRSLPRPIVQASERHRCATSIIEVTSQTSIQHRLLVTRGRFMDFPTLVLVPPSFPRVLADLVFI
jgi:hypothetical protein